MGEPRKISSSRLASLNGKLRGSASRAPARAAFKGTGSLAVNGGSLIVNVFVSGIGGFAFWIIAARSAEPEVVARASAMITSILGVTTVSQQSLVVNLPILIAGSSRPRRLVARAYIAAIGITALIALLYIFVGTRTASGLAYLRDVRLAIIFFLGCAMWSIFSLQDAVLTGVRRGRLVLLENTSWAISRLVLVLALPIAGLELGVGWLVATWLVPASLLVIAITLYLFTRQSSPIRQSIGTHIEQRRGLFSFLGIEYLGSLTNGLVQIVVPAVALTTLGARAAAPFLAANSLLVVTEVAMGSFVGAFAVEVRRHGRASRNLLVLTCGLLGAVCFVAVVGAQFFGKNFMALFGREYRQTGGAVLAILVLGLPATAVRLLSSVGNRLRRDGWRNFAQQLVYCVTLFAAFKLAHVQTARSLAVCLVTARVASAVVALLNLNNIRLKRARTSAGNAEPIVV